MIDGSFSLCAYILICIYYIVQHLIGILAILPYHSSQNCSLLGFPTGQVYYRQFTQYIFQLVVG